MKKLRNSKGQVALIVLLVSAVIMTLGLSMSKQTVVETRIDADEELLKQAFNAAESGIDYYLGSKRVGYTAPDAKSMANITVTSIGEGTTMSYGEYITENGTALIWLVNHDSNGNIGSTYYGGDTVEVCVDNDFGGALKIDYFYRLLAGTNYRINRIGYNFDTETVTGYPIEASNCVTINTINNPLLLAITPIGDGTNLNLTGEIGDNFPSQGEQITSVGRAGDVSAGVSRKITVQRRYVIPMFMLETITASGVVTSQ